MSMAEYAKDPDLVEAFARSFGLTQDQMVRKVIEFGQLSEGLRLNTDDQFFVLKIDNEDESIHVTNSFPIIDDALRFSFERNLEALSESEQRLEATFYRVYTTEGKLVSRT